MLKRLLFRARSARYSKEMSYSVVATPTTPNSQIPPDMGDESSKP